MSTWTTHILERVRAKQTTPEDFSKLGASSVGDPILDYNGFMYALTGAHAAHASYPLATNFSPESKVGRAANTALHQIATELCCDLLNEAPPGAVTEFGVFAGRWLSDMLAHMEATGRQREIYGFDSFEGLPPPDAENDSEGWREGEYAARLEDVERALSAATRPHLHLVKGWFSDTLPQTDVRSIAFAKIDCDLYEPAKQCLAYLARRMADGGVLMFDDWTHVANTGETKAFMEWVPTVPHYRFEMIGFIGYRLFLRVWRR